MAEKDTVFDKLLRRVKNHPVLSAAMLLGLAIGAVAQLTGNLKQIVDTVRPFVTPSSPDLHLSALKVRAPNDPPTLWGNAPTLLDMTMRNISKTDAVVHAAELIWIGERTINTSRQGGIGPLLPYSAVYDLLMTSRQQRARLDLSQIILAGTADRFIIAVGLGQDQDQDGTAESVTALRSDDIIQQIKGSAKLRLIYNEQQVLESDEFELTLYDMGGASRVGVPGKVNVRDRLALLHSKDVGEVWAAVEILATLGDEMALSSLKELRSRDLRYLQDEYAKTFQGTPDAFDDLGIPTPEELYRGFLRDLDATIRRLESRRP